MTQQLADDEGDGFHEVLMACPPAGCHLWEVVVEAAKEGEGPEQLMSVQGTDTHQS